MQAYTYHDFLNTLDDTGRGVTEAIYQHITQNHPEYQPYGILPGDKAKKEWSLHFRKSPKHGKPLCSLFSSDGALSVRFIFYSPMANEVLLRQNEFGEKIRTEILRACACRGCGYFGDKEFCWCQHHYYINSKLLYSCNCAWFTVDNIKEGDLSENDIRDLLYLSDLQSKHMSKNAKESRGANYDEENLLRSGAISVIKLKRAELDIDVFDPADYADIKRLDQYAMNYHFTPMGASNGLWYYFDDKAVCGMPIEDYKFTIIPEGNYAKITVSNPFTFSAVRAWDYICLWMRKKNMLVNSVDIGGLKTHTLVKFFKQGANQMMEMYVPVKDTIITELHTAYQE